MGDTYACHINFNQNAAKWTVVFSMQKSTRIEYFKVCPLVLGYSCNNCYYRLDEVRLILYYIVCNLNAVLRLLRLIVNETLFNVQKENKILFTDFSQYFVTTNTLYCGNTFSQILMTR